MATYTAPTTRTTGALISASIWNTDIVENLKYFKDAPVFDGDISVGDDIFLTSTGAVINFASGDVTITHSTNTLTFAGAASGYVFNDGNLVVDTNTLYVDATNNRVGIGTSSPSFPLHAMTTGTGTTAAANAVARFASNGTGYDVFCQFSDTVTNSGGIGMLSGNMYIHAGGAERMRIDTSGNVGIGTSSPGSRLDVQTTAQSVANIVSSNAAGGYLNLGRSGANAIIGSYNAASGGGSTINADALFLRNANGIGFGSGGAGVTAHLTSGGNFAIGATARLYLDGVAGTGDTYLVESSANVLELVSGGTVGLRVNAQGVNTVTGSQSVNSGVATTLFSVTTKGLYEVFAYYPAAGAIYLSCGRVMSDGAGFYRATFDNGAGLTLSLSTSNVQATQSSSLTLTIQYRYVRISD